MDKNANKAPSGSKKWMPMKGKKAVKHGVRIRSPFKGKLITKSPKG